MADKETTLNITGKLKNYVAQLEENRTQGRIVIKKNEIKWREPGDGSKLARLIAPENGFDIKLHVTALVEIPPGGKGPKHRHGDAAIFILSGRGYSIVNGKRYDYEEGDAAFMPAGVWHQQFNADPEKPMRFLAAQGLYLGMVLSENED